jgi:hypothetical protein
VKTYGEVEIRHLIEMSGQLLAPDALLPGGRPIFIEWEVGWAAEPVWMRWLREIFLPLSEIKNLVV